LSNNFLPVKSEGIMLSKRREAGNIELLAGNLSLDFINTLSSRLEPYQREYLSGYNELVEWSCHAGILPAEEAQRLKRLGMRRPAEAVTVLNRALEVREGLFRIFSALAQGKVPRDGDIDGLNETLQDTMGRLQVRRVKDQFHWEWTRDPSALDAMLWPIVHAAAELLVQRERSKVRQCANMPVCQWLFLDKSKNRSRRWCSMDVCGSRDKVKRYYHRKKQTG
jgi:predicted RNA-binding Zn ribbon-like protein